ncbi:hypothetical protein [Teichococcus rhizosphaerae]|uniref:hypothetical protein n=1 Tax=Teichococcus rhizosphaerae TaxID=1335062 RepID=UPI001145219A|nr:hypothetical protein [Pseudoroseomonas rhizosphaerae]
MAGTIGRIARALVQGAVRRQQYRAMGAVGLRGWKLDLLRALRGGRRGPMPHGEMPPRATRRD